MPYSYPVLKSNIQRLLEQRSLRVVDLESKAKKGRIVNNILSGTSTNPTIDTINSIAVALNVNIEDLLLDDTVDKKVDDALFIDTTIKLISEIKPLVSKHNININSIFNLIKESYNYSKDLNLTEADQKFIQWIIKQKYNC